MSIDKRVKELEGRLFDFSFPKGTTKIARESFITKELEIFDKIDALFDAHPYIPKERIAGANRELFDAGTKILWLRVFDLFRTTMEIYLGLEDDGVGSLIFWGRFFKFFDETRWLIQRHRLEDAKIQELFGNDPLWYSDDENAIPDSDPRWKVLHDYLDDLEKQHEEEVKKEMVDSAFSSMDKGNG